MLAALASSVGLPTASEIKVVIRYEDGEEEELKGGRGAWKLFRTAEPSDTIIIDPPPPAATPGMNPKAATSSFTPTANTFTSVRAAAGGGGAADDDGDHADGDDVVCTSPSFADDGGRSNRASPTPKRRKLEDDSQSDSAQDAEAPAPAPATAPAPAMNPGTRVTSRAC